MFELNQVLDIIFECNVEKKNYKQQNFNITILSE